MHTADIFTRDEYNRIELREFGLCGFSFNCRLGFDLIYYMYMYIYCGCSFQPEKILVIHWRQLRSCQMIMNSPAKGCLSLTRPQEILFFNIVFLICLMCTRTTINFIPCPFSVVGHFLWVLIFPFFLCDTLIHSMDIGEIEGMDGEWLA